MNDNCFDECDQDDKSAAVIKHTDMRLLQFSILPLSQVHHSMH